MALPNWSSSRFQAKVMFSLIAALFLVSLLAEQIHAVGFAPTGNLLTPRGYHTATLLPDGTALVAGGSNTDDFSFSELYGPGDFSWSATGPLTSPRRYHTATILPNGSVLVVGGSNGQAILSSAELYNPAIRKWSPAGNLSVARYQHTATLLANGTVLVAGGVGSTTTLSSVEIYDPATNTWTAAEDLSIPRRNHNSALLTNRSGAGYGWIRRGYSAILLGTFRSRIRQMVGGR